MVIERENLLGTKVTVDGVRTTLNFLCNQFDKYFVYRETDRIG